MSEQPEDQSGTAEQPAAWPEAEEAPAWAKIVDDAESSAPGPAGPGASSQGEAPTQASGGVQPATEAGRSRRPTSLRDEYVQDSDGVPRRRLSAPTFPSVAGSQVTPAAAEGPGTPGDGAQAPHSSRVRLPSPTSLLGKLPTGRLSTDRASTDKLPLGKLPTDRLPVDRLRTLVKQRPEVGLGLAFGGGLVIATILKRLGRR